jgi:nucleoside-diphosphate-sugar epimerase
MRMIVTGNPGFIGTHLMRTLEEEAHNVAAVDPKEGNIRDSRY